MRNNKDLKIFFFLIRFIDSALSSKDVTRSQILSLRVEYLKKNSNTKCYIGFISEDNFYNDLEQKLHVPRNKTLHKHSNFSKSKIDEAEKMFITLFSCPSFYEKVYWKAIFGPTSKMIKLASKILKKSEGKFEPRALNIFSKMSAVLGKPSTLTFVFAQLSGFRNFYKCNFFFKM